MLGLELALRGVLEGATFGIAGLGFAIIFLAARELNFAYGVTIAIGGYVTYSTVSAGLPFGVAAGVGVLFCTVLGATLRYAAFRKLRDHYAVLLVSFGFAVVLENVLHIVYGVHDVVVRSEVLARVVTFSDSMRLSARVIDLLSLMVLVLAWLVVRYAFERTKTGLGLIAVIRDPEMAELVGVRVERMKVLAYAMGSALAGTAGALTAASSGVRPSLGFELLLFGFIATLLARVSGLSRQSAARGELMSRRSWR
ncbi:MAG: branched-chain amino acid ABC transporter permease [Nitriliruptor sp.]|uniref:branched-chain amino acid ABC transporter permease n=1 Tax=Nitriliruptor sp. TaxID=2448056 RepID=UPI00349FE2F9